MVNFRYHLVSLTAVFLALAAGITIGAGVVDRATVDRIESQLRQVEARRKETNATNDRLQTDLGRWGAFSEATADGMVTGCLTGAKVFIVGVAGSDRRVIDDFRGVLARAGASVEATAWLTAKWGLTQADDIRDLTPLAPVVMPAQPEEVRAAATTRLAQSWTSTDASFVAALTAGGFIEFDDPSPQPVPGPSPDTVFVVFSGDGAEVPPDQLAHPLVDRLTAAERRVLAAQPVRKPQDDAAAPPLQPEFVFALRSDGDVAARVSSVDNLDDRRGQVAAVLAIDALREGNTGHFGFGPATRPVPEPVTCS